jgi:hypothetical protein
MGQERSAVSRSGAHLENTHAWLHSQEPEHGRDDLWRRALRELLSTRLSGVPIKWYGCQRVVDRSTHARRHRQ